MPGTYNLQSPPKEVGETIPANTPHAVSVTLPTWNSNVAYEEGEHWVHSKMRSGYPRFVSPSVRNSLILLDL
jgi:cystathionine gamma-synthase